MPKVEDRLRELALDHAGYFTSKQAEEAGIARKLVVQLAERARIARVGHGIYRFDPWPDADLRQYHEALLWPQAQRTLAYAAISHESALELYGLTDLNPGVLHITIPPKTRIVRKIPSWIRIHKAVLERDERTTERGVPVVSVPRAIAEIARTRGTDVVHRAISEARARNLLREDELERLASAFGSAVLEPYHAE
jgi:predicted transcriptional regulator of viral defense system